MLLGYNRDFGKKRADVGIGNSEHTYVSLFLTIEPPLGTAPELKELVSIGSIEISFWVFPGCKIGNICRSVHVTAVFNVRNV